QDQNADDANSPNLQITAPEPKRGKDERYAYRTEQWAELYAKLIDKTIAALKSKGVPVIWVGLPAVRGTKSTSDTAYLNDLFRAQAEKAGIVYVDIWDGFIDEAGKFTSYGPDVEGQPRRLRSEDGVHFTKAGARKLAHYVERELRRVMSVRTLPVAFPSDDGIQAPGILRPGLPRPAAGPVVPLTADAVPGSEELLGGGTARVGRPDPIAERVLVKGEAIAPLKGRADDFVQTPAVGGAATAPSSTEKSAVNEPALSAPAQVPSAAQPTSDQKPGNDAAASGKRTSRSDETAADSAGSQAAAAQPAQRKRARDVPRPPAPLGGAAAFIPFNWFR
ncbi:MAG: SGNH/GDSL hydrolase family protein, partial [Xanthobacteraceae bacterium]